MTHVVGTWKHFEAVVLSDGPSIATQRVDLVAQSWEVARQLLHARFGVDGIVHLLCVEDAERPR